MRSVFTIGNARTCLDVPRVRYFIDDLRVVEDAGGRSLVNMGGNRLKEVFKEIN